MRWDWFPINVASAINSRMRRRTLLDSLRIHYENRIARDGYIDDLGGIQARLTNILVPPSRKGES